jgi:hypothetical protein
MTEKLLTKWTDEQCLLLEPIWQLARVRRNAHHMAYRFFHRYNTITNLPSVLFGAILSTICFDPTTVPNFVSAGMAMFMTAIATMNVFFSLARSLEGHKQSYKAFNMLVREIEVNLIRGREDPKRAFLDFQEYVNEQFTKIVENTPTLNPAARRYLDDYRGSRPSPFYMILKGDKNATGFDSSLDDNGYEIYNNERHSNYKSNCGGTSTALIKHTPLNTVKIEITPTNEQLLETLGKSEKTLEFTELIQQTQKNIIQQH